MEIGDVANPQSGSLVLRSVSPWPAPFSPQVPPKFAALCSSGSSIVWCGTTPPQLARPPSGFRPSRTGLVPFRAEALRRSPGSRACRFSAYAGSETTQDRRLARDYRETLVWPSSNQERVGVLVCVFRSSIARPTDTLCTLQATTRDVTRKTEGQDGVAVFLLVGLFQSLQQAGLTRHSLTSTVRFPCFRRRPEIRGDRGSQDILECWPS